MAKKKTGSSRLVEVFDILFIMLLCFVTLLATMLMRGKVLVGSGSGGGLDYSFKLGSFSITAGFLLLYLFYIISHSDKELKNFFIAHYGPRERSVQPEEKDLKGGSGQ